MKPTRLIAATLILAAWGGPCSGVRAQNAAGSARPLPVTAPADQPPAETTDLVREREQVERRLAAQDEVHIGQDYVVQADRTVGDLVLVFGSATIEGTVAGDVTVVMGSTALGRNAVVYGSLVVVGGNAVISPGARVHRDLVAVGGTVDAPPEFVAGGQVVVGPVALGDGLRMFVPWVTRGLMWGRLIVPGVPWVWAVLGIFFLVYLTLSLMFDSAAREGERTLAARPLGSFLAGILVLALFGPLSVVLVASLVGIAVVPLLVCAVVVAALMGKVSIARWLGGRLVPQRDAESRLQATRSFVLGFVLLAGAYALPIVGFMTWAMVSVFGLGAATLVFLAAFRREMPARPPRPVPVPVLPTPIVATAAPEIPTASASSTPLSAEPVSFGSPTSADLTAFPRATLADRGMASFIDGVLIFVVTNAFGMILAAPREPTLKFFLLLLIYNIAFWAVKGTTIGGIVCHLRVVRTDGTPLRLADAFLRGFASMLSVVPLGIGYLWIGKTPNPDKQAWHDIIAGTCVVKVPRDWPLP